MNRISSLTLGTIVTICGLGVACASGGDDDGKPNNSTAGNTGAGGNTGVAGNGAGGNVIPIAGNGPSAAGSSPTGGSPPGVAGTPGAGGGTGASVCDGMTRSLPLAEAYIDNFETDTRFTGWYAFSDTVPANMPAIARVAGGAISTGMTAHVAATGIKPPTMMGYGAGAGFNLVNPVLEKCLDVTAFDGISFWAKGTSGTMNVVKFQAVAPATQPSDAMPAGDCKPMTACAYLHPAKNITLTPDWTQHTIAFADLTSAAGKFAGNILGFNIITPDAAWDISIDEVTFYKGTAPTTPVEPPVAGGGTGGTGGGGSTAGAGGTGGTQ